MPNVSDIEFRVAALVERHPEGVDESFVYDLILAMVSPRLLLHAFKMER